MFGIKRDRSLDRGRRRALLDLAMGTTAFGVGAVAGMHPAIAQVAAAQDAAAAKNDLNAVQSEIWMEQVAIALYALAEGLLSPELKPVAALFGGHHAVHLEHASAAFEQLGGDPDDAALTPDLSKLPEFPDDASFLRYALRVETMAVDAYVGLVGQLSSRTLRVQAAQILGGELAHVIALRVASEGMSFGEATDIVFTTDFNPYLPARDP